MKETFIEARGVALLMRQGILLIRELELWRSEKFRTLVTWSLGE